MSIKNWLLSIIENKQHKKIANALDIDFSNSKRKTRNLAKSAEEIETIAKEFGLTIEIKEK